MGECKEEKSFSFVHMDNKTSESAGFNPLKQKQGRFNLKMKTE
jgi:hypothetical protein